MNHHHPSRSPRLPLGDTIAANVRATSASVTAVPAQTGLNSAPLTAVGRPADGTHTVREALTGLDWKMAKAEPTTVLVDQHRQSAAPNSIDKLFGLLGHGRECSELATAGQIASCTCRTTPMDDPAVAVGLAMHFAKTALARGIPMPRSVIWLLESRIQEGDATCQIVGQWLDERGLLGSTSSVSKGVE